MEHSPSWEANRSSASQEIPEFYGTRRFITTFTSSGRLSLPWARSIQSIPPSHFKTLLVAYQRPTEMFRNILTLHGEELLAPRRNPKLECHPLSAVRDCLLNIFAATLFCISGGGFLHLNLGDEPCCGDMDPLITIVSFRTGLANFNTHVGHVFRYVLAWGPHLRINRSRGGDWIQ